uniref:Metallophosphoesterase n=1 Tax=Prevotella sp. GTC17253 TaxID=3236793 RepID=A0AB33ISI8_9BACT
MRKTILFLLLLCAMTVYGIKITHGPYICDMDSTGVTIVWQTDKPGMAWVELAEPGEDHFYSKERTKYFDTAFGRRVLNDTIHHVHIKGLKPGTQYRYRIFTQELKKWIWDNKHEMGDIASSVVYKHEPYSFRTFPTQTDDLTFIVLNDIHERADFMKTLCKDVDFKKTDFVVLNGDMSNRIDTSDEIYKGYIDTCVAMFATSVPMLMNRGNHETRGGFSEYLHRFFPTEDGKFYRLRNFGGIDFLFIDSGEDKPDTDIEYYGTASYDAYRTEQAQWLDQLIAKGEIGKRPLIVFSHIPPTLHHWHGANHMLETIIPRLNQLNVTVMLSGHLHQHAYAEAGGPISFPNIANSNMAYMKCHIHQGKITIDCIETGNKRTHHYEYKLK